MMNTPRFRAGDWVELHSIGLHSALHRGAARCNGMRVRLDGTPAFHQNQQWYWPAPQDVRHRIGSTGLVPAIVTISENCMTPVAYDGNQPVRWDDAGSVWRPDPAFLALMAMGKAGTK